MIGRSVIAIVALGLLSAGCASGPEAAEAARKSNAKITVIKIGGKSFDCINKGEIGLNTSSYELKGNLRARFITPEAALAQVRVWVASSEVSNYGSTKVTYSDVNDSCVFWSEGLTLQEFHQRLNQTPIGLSPYYQVEKPAPVVTPTPTPTPTATPTPTPPKYPYTKADLDKQVGQFKLRELLQADVVKQIEAQEK